MKQKIFPLHRDHALGLTTLIGIIIIIAVAVVLFGGVFSYQYYLKSQTLNQNAKTTNSPVQSQQATEGWKTYTNTEYGFEFNYPGNWETYEKPGQVNLGPKDKTFSYEGMKYSPFRVIFHKGSMQDDINDRLSMSCIKEDKKIEVNSLSFVKLTERCPWPYADSLYLDLDAGNYLVLNYDIKIYNEVKNIISTFKFTK